MAKVREIDCERFLKNHNGTIDKELKSIRLVKGYSWSISGNSTYQWAYLETSRSGSRAPEWGGSWARSPRRETRRSWIPRP